MERKRSVIKSSRIVLQSPRASDVLAEASARRVKEDNDDVAHTEEFKSILKEVEQLGVYHTSSSTDVHLSNSLS